MSCFTFVVPVLCDFLLEYHVNVSQLFMYFTDVDIFSELIQIKCECPGMESKTKSFLLDNGRLQYEAVRRAFDLVTLEIVIGMFEPICIEILCFILQFYLSL